MTLIQINKPLGREYLANNFGVEFPLADWVSAKLSEDNHVEANRYDITKKDAAGDTWSVYLYMNEDSDLVIAIDDTACNSSRGEWYDSTLDSPFGELLRLLESPTPVFESERQIHEFSDTLKHNELIVAGLPYQFLRPINNVSRGEYTECLNGKSYYNHEERRHISLLEHNGQIVYVETSHHYVSPEEQKKTKAIFKEEI